MFNDGYVQLKKQPMSLVEDSAVQRWLSNYAPDNRRVKLVMLKGFLGYLQGVERFKGQSPSGLVEFQANTEKRDQYLILDALQDYVRGMSGTYSSLTTRYSTIKVFFSKSRAPLPDDHFKINPKREPVSSHLSLDHIKILISHASSVMKPFYLTVWMGLLDCERFRILNEGYGSKLAEHIKTKGVDEPFLFEYPGRKGSLGKTKFYTYVGHDALAAWKQYFELRRDWPKEGEPLLFDRYGHVMTKKALRASHLRLTERLRFLKRGRSSASRYGYNMHEFRDVARTLLHLQGKKDGLDLECVEFWMGHTTDPNHYDKFYTDKDYTLEQYRKAEKYLNILSGKTEQTIDLQRLKQVEERLKEINLKMEQYIELTQQREVKSSI
jgi:hypothetical protein